MRKDFALIRIKNDLFVLRAEKANSECDRINPRGSFDFFFVLIVFCRILRLLRQHCPIVTNFVSPLHELFSCAGYNYSNYVLLRRKLCCSYSYTHEDIREFESSHSLECCHEVRIGKQNVHVNDNDPRNNVHYLSGDENKA